MTRAGFPPILRSMLLLPVAVLVVASPLSAATHPALPDIPATVRIKLSGSLQMQLLAKQRMAHGLWADERVDNWLIRRNPATRSRGLDDQLVFVHLADYPTEEQVSAMEQAGAELILADWVPPLPDHPDGFFLARVPVDRIASLAALPFVLRLGNGEDVLAPQNDQARILTGVTDAVTEYGMMYNQGSGVRVAVLDSGVEIAHPDIPEPVYAVDYSAWPDSDFTVGNTVTGHGTHTAATVLGRGTMSGGLYAGMAPDAEPVFLKIGDDAEALETAAGVAHSFLAARMYYGCDVSSMSYGYFNEFMDGSAENEQAVDYVVADGMLVFVSAGNSANDDYHASFTVPANTMSGFVSIHVSNGAAGQPLLVNGIAYDGPDIEERTLFDLALYDENLQPLGAAVSDQQQSPRGTEGRYILGDDPLPGGGTTRYLTVSNNSGHDQLFHAYVGIQTLGPYSVSYRFDSPDPSCTVGSPALADGAIAMAAYVSKNEWVDYEGNPHNSGMMLGDIASFSSHGPRIDGLQKPDLAAPGSYLASARDHEVPELQPGGWYDSLILSNPGDPVGTPGDYVLFQGTSMACPAASGATAAVLANWYRFDDFPSLTHMARQVLLDTALEDGFTGATPNDVWGYGKIDVLGLAEFIVNDLPEPVRAVLPGEFAIVSMYPNPFNARATAVVALPYPARVTVTLLNLLGQEVGVVADGVYTAGQHTVALNADRLASGTYLLKVALQDGQVRTAKVTVVK